MNGLSMFSAPAKPAPTTSASPTETPTTPEEIEEGVPVTTTSTADRQLVIETNQDKFGTEVLQASKPVLVDFYADWCGPCKQMAPTIEKLANQYDGRIQVFKVNIDNNPRLVAKYNIQSIPTFIIFKNGASAETFAGSMPRAELATAIDKHLN